MEQVRRWGGRLGITAGLALLALPALSVLVALGPDIFNAMTTMVVLAACLALLLGFFGLFGKMH